MMEIAFCLFYLIEYGDQTCSLPLKEWLNEYVVIEVFALAMEIYRYYELKQIYNSRMESGNIVNPNRNSVFYDDEL